MTSKLNFAAPALIALTFAVALLAMLQMVATSASALSATHTAPTYGSAMLQMVDEGF